MTDGSSHDQYAESNCSHDEAIASRLVSMRISLGGGASRVRGAGGGGRGLRRAMHAMPGLQSRVREPGDEAKLS